MGHINENSVLDFYIEQIHQDNIEFLKERDEFKKQIENKVLELKNDESEHSKIQVAKDLWKLLFEASMSYIDPDKGGYDRLFKYFDEYVDFEELIFASDSFYRDHTLHCLWVYFLGEYIIKSRQFNFITESTNTQYNILHNIHEDMKKLNNDGFLDESVKMYGDLIRHYKNDDSIRCISALTHDLGYPLKKIYRINKSIKNILPYFDVENYDEFNFNYSGTQQNFIDCFINLLSWNIYYSTLPEYENTDIEDKYTYIGPFRNILGINWEALKEISQDELLKLKRTFIMELNILQSTSSKFRYSNDFEKYQHGIMSAFLLMKNLNAFKKINVLYYDYTHIPTYANNFSDIQSKTDILRAISDHTCENYQIRNLSTTSSFLTFIDELEEFSRTSRANQNRQYVSEFCKTDIYMKDEYMNIDFTFDNTKIGNLDPEIAFKERCKRFLSLFDIPNLDEEFKIRLSCIGKLPYDDNTYTLEISRKYANIFINGAEQSIPRYLKTTQFYTKEEYMKM